MLSGQTKNVGADDEIKFVPGGAKTHAMEKAEARSQILTIIYAGWEAKLSYAEVRKSLREAGFKKNFRGKPWTDTAIFN